MFNFWRVSAGYWLLLGVLGCLISGLGWYWLSPSATRITPLVLPTLDGQKVHLPDAWGRYSWVNTWSSSCPSCLPELPELDALQREYADRLQVVAIAMPYDPPNTLVEVQARLQLTLPIALDLDGQAARQFAPDLIVPSHHLLDPAGHILHSVQGQLTRADLRAMLNTYLPPPLTR